MQAAIRFEIENSPNPLKDEGTKATEVNNDWETNYNKTKHEILDYFWIFFGTLVILMVYLFKETLNSVSPDKLPADAPSLKGNPAPEDVLIVRLIAAIYLHFLFLEEYEQGLKLMKYSINHSWKFDSWYLSFFIGLVQFTMLLAVETYSLCQLI